MVTICTHLVQHGDPIPLLLYKDIVHRGDGPFLDLCLTAQQSFKLILNIAAFGRKAIEKNVYQFETGDAISASFIGIPKSY